MGYCALRTARKVATESLARPQRHNSLHILSLQYFRSALLRDYVFSFFLRNGGNDLVPYFPLTVNTLLFLRYADLKTTTQQISIGGLQ